MKKQTAILYSLIFLLLVATALFVFVEFPSAGPDTAAVILPDTSSEDDDEDEAETPLQPVEVNTETVQAAIRTLSRANAYSRTITTESYLDGEVSTKNIDVWVQGDSAKLVISRSDRDEVLNVLILDDEKWVWYEGLYGSYNGAAGEAEADRYQSILSYESVLELSKSSITDAGYCEYQGEMCIFVRYLSPLPGYENTCYVDLASGLAIGEESYNGEELVFRAVSTLPDLAAPDEEVFELP